MSCLQRLFETARHLPRIADRNANRFFEAGPARVDSRDNGNNVSWRDADRLLAPPASPRDVASVEHRERPVHGKISPRYHTAGSRSADG